MNNLCDIHSQNGYKRRKTMDLEKLILVFLLSLTPTTVAAEYAPIPTLGEESAYTYEEIPSAEENSVTLYEINNLQKTFSYTNEAGETVTKEYTIKEILPHYYNLNISASSSDRFNNSETLDSVTKHFISQNATNSNQGGAITNQGTIGEIIGDFISNANHTDYPKGGAIFNDGGSITSINGDFISNTSGAGGGWGGAIGNESNDRNNSASYIGTITGNFINNTTTASETTSSQGGAIWNTSSNTYEARIDLIDANFINNSSTSNTGWNIAGGAIGNASSKASIGTIKGSFIGNHASSDSGYYLTTSGGAILNQHGTIENIEADFFNNYSSSFESSGGAIRNIGRVSDLGSTEFDGKIKNINSNFFNNYVNGDYIASGGAISNDGLIESIKGLFYQNKTIGKISSSGGAIENRGLSSDGPFPGYSTYSAASSGLIKSINADFIQNKSLGKQDTYGGAISNGGSIQDIKGNFIENNVTTTPENRTFETYLLETRPSIRTLGGAIYNTGKISTINANFINNSATTEQNYVSTFAIVEEPTQTKLTAGGAIYNGGNIGTTHTSDGKNILRISILQLNIYDDQGQFVNHYTEFDEETIQHLKEHCTQNNIALDIKIAEQNLTLGEDISEEDLNYYYVGNANNIKEDLKNYIAKDISIQGGIINSSFINNYASGEKAYGGAIYTTKDLKISAENSGISIFQGNHTISNGVVDDNAIYVENGNTLILSATDNGTIILEDKIGGGLNNENSLTSASIDNSYNVKITGDSTGKVILNNNIDLSVVELELDGTEHPLNREYPANIQLEHTNLILGKRDNVLDGNNLQLDSGYLGMINNGVGVAALNKLSVNGNTKMGVDVDLANKEMDRFTANEYDSHRGNVIVTNVNLLSDADPNEKVTAVYFAEPGLKNNVTNGIGNAPNGGQTSVYSPIYKYDVTYDNVNQYDGKGDGGYFLFSRGDGNTSEDFNPSVIVGPAATQAAGAAVITETFRYAFQHADTFSPMPSSERMALIKQNYYALENSESISDVTHFPINVGEQNKGFWVKPYTFFESLDLKNGPTVDTITYGTLVGGDSKLFPLKNGYTGVLSAYVGYNGSSQNFKGVDANLNGGLLGLTNTLYKGNFFNATTASVGASFGEAHTMYGSENFTMLLAGIANKSGYNFEFKDGKFIIQPLLQLSYTFVKTFDYTNAAGVRMEIDPMHTITINPGIRFIANLKDKWQPYASVSMVWTPLNESSAMANNVKLPEMTIKPYIEYGLGIQKTWDEKNTAFLQAMVRNGGRTGIAFTGGYRRAIGKDNLQREKHLIKEFPQQEL